LVGPSKSRPPMSHRKTDLGIPCRSKSAKVVLVGLLLPRRRPDRALSLADFPQPPRSSRVLCLGARQPLLLVKEIHPAHICNVWRGGKPHKGFCALLWAA